MNSIVFRHLIFAGLITEQNNSDTGKLKKGEIYQFEFGKNYDSVLKLNDIRTVSINRILYQQNGMIATISNKNKQIEPLVLKKYFPSFYYDYNQFQPKAVLLEKQQKGNDAALKELTSKNEELKEQIAALQEQLSRIRKIGSAHL